MNKNIHSMITRAKLILAFAAFLILAPQAAVAGDFPELAPDEGMFAENEMVPDEQLEEMRGGSLVINGVTFSFNYFSQVELFNPTYNISEIRESSFTSNSFNTANSAANTLAPLVVQNNLPGSVINAIQILDVTTQGALSAANFSQFSSSIDYSSVMAARY